MATTWIVILLAAAAVGLVALTGIGLAVALLLTKRTWRGLPPWK
ncbi:MAG TPA: hypothetical protein VK689_04675 [Armatimonadota bacterium]|jgi:hypothetical protein|nr:hypothetical protein [Armatimonadota bacterium]